MVLLLVAPQLRFQQQLCVVVFARYVQYVLHSFLTIFYCWSFYSSYWYFLYWHLHVSLKRWQPPTVKQMESHTTTFYFPFIEHNESISLIYPNYLASLHFAVVIAVAIEQAEHLIIEFADSFLVKPMQVGSHSSVI